MLQVPGKPFKIKSCYPNFSGGSNIRLGRLRFSETSSWCSATELKLSWCLQPFDCAEVLYFDYKQLGEDREKELGCKFAEMDDLIKKCDAITVNLPLTDKTK